MRVEPSELAEVISVTPAMRPSERSSGVATVAAMVSGLAPGSDACTEMVGKSTWGSGATGNLRKATMPASATPKVRRVVATGRWMKGVDSIRLCLAGLRLEPCGGSPAEATFQSIESQVDHGGSEEGQQ